MPHPSERRRILTRSPEIVRPSPVDVARFSSGNWFRPRANSFGGGVVASTVASGLNPGSWVTPINWPCDSNPAAGCFFSSGTTNGTVESTYSEDPKSPPSGIHVKWPAGLLNGNSSYRNLYNGPLDGTPWTGRRVSAYYMAFKMDAGWVGAAQNKLCIFSTGDDEQLNYLELDGDALDPLYISIIQQYPAGQEHVWKNGDQDGISPLVTRDQVTEVCYMFDLGTANTFNARFKLWLRTAGAGGAWNLVYNKTALNMVATGQSNIIYTVDVTNVWGGATTPPNLVADQYARHYHVRLDNTIDVNDYDTFNPLLMAA